MIGDWSMRFAVSVTNKDARMDAYIVFRGIEESIKRISAYGYSGIELGLRHKDDINLQALEKLLSIHNLDLCCINTGQAFSEMHLYLTHSDIVMRQQAIDVFSGFIDVAKQFHAMVNIGRTGGYVPFGQTREQTNALFIDSLSYLLEKAEHEGVCLVLEPINRYESNFVNSIPECMEFVNWFNSPYLGLLPDLFHMNIEDTDMGETLAQCGKRIKYMHFADSNRKAPGWGHLDFDDIFAGLARADFRGWCCCDVLPIPTPDEAAIQSIGFLKRYAEKYNLSSKPSL